MSQLYLIENDKEFKGVCFEIIDTNKIDFMRYCQLHPNESLTGLNEKTFLSLVSEYLDNMCKIWKEITEDQYNYSLECLPPARWEGKSFFVSECYTHNLYPFCTERDGKYYASNQRICEKMSVIQDSLTEWLINNKLS